MRIRAHFDHADVPAEAVVLRASAREGLSELFDVHVEFSCDNPDLELAGLIGSSGALILESISTQGALPPRCFHGADRQRRASGSTSRRNQSRVRFSSKNPPQYSGGSFTKQGSRARAASA